MDPNSGGLSTGILLISGLEALAQWYFRGDPSAVEKALGSRLDQFMYWMDSKELQLDAASRAESAINAL
jgi:hypothetical protein